MFEILEHTADIGFRARGASEAEMFAAAAEALVSVAVELEGIEPKQAYPVVAEGEDREALLVNWLSEVLYLLDGKGIAMGRFGIQELQDGRVAGEGWGEPRDPARHHAKLVVKGVTYHQLRIFKDHQGWCAEVFLDI